MGDPMVDAPAASNGERAPGKAPRVDGRRLRSERTRRLIVEAYMALVRENAQMPTAVQIAERAGYSVRSIFERFPDLTALRVAVTDYAIAEARAQCRVARSRRRSRDAHQVAGRAARPRAASDGCRCGACCRPTPRNRPTCISALRLIRQLIVMRMEMMFKPELSAMADSDRRKIVLALESITDFESWARMRELYGLSFEEASAVWVRAIDRLLPATPRLEFDELRSPRPLPIDGRRLRSERTRQLIIEAYLALLREDPQVPTSAQIAERAGYSVRSVFERFPDLLSLRIAATDHAFAAGQRAGSGARRRRRSGDPHSLPGRDARADLREMAAAVARAQRQPG